MKDLKEFNSILLKTSTDEERLKFIRKYIFHGLPYVFHNREAEYFDFRYRIAKNFNVHFDEVFIVGSGKLGFSYHKNKDFDFDSDIDVVIVNNELFNQYHHILSDFQYNYDSSYFLVSTEEKMLYSEFLKYFIKGWMRPDKLPISFQVKLLKDNWFNYFKSISYGKSEVGNYKVSGGLYKDYFYLEKYYLSNITKYYDTERFKG